MNLRAVKRWLTSERVRAFRAARLDPSSYLGLHLTVGLAIASAGVWALGALVDAVLDNRTMVRWDIAADAWLQARTTATGHQIFQEISNWGSPNAMAWLGVIGAIGLWVTRRRVLLVGWVAAFAGAQLLATVLKLVVKRNRPDYIPAYALRHSYSFPSAHAMASIVGLGMLVYVATDVWRPPPVLRWVIALAAAAFIGAIGFSRVYLGVHYPSDVLGGYIAGAAWIAVCMSATGVALHHRGTRRRSPA